MATLIKERQEFTTDCRCLGLGFVVPRADYMRTTVLSVSVPSAFIFETDLPPEGKPAELVISKINSQIKSTLILNFLCFASRT